MIEDKHIKCVDCKYVRATSPQVVKIGQHSSAGMRIVNFIGVY